MVLLLLCFLGSAVGPFCGVNDNFVDAVQGLHEFLDVLKLTLGHHLQAHKGLVQQRR